jgi:hypothetical protein
LRVSEQLPGKGLLGWLGRQVGYVKRAVKADVTRQTIYRDERVEEAKLPQDPSVTLRRTTVDEVIVTRRDAGTGAVER